MKQFVIRGIVLAGICGAAVGQSISISEGCVGTIREAADASKPLGTAFVAGLEGKVVTVAHIASSGSGNYTYEAFGSTVPAGERVTGLKLDRLLPSEDLAVFTPEIAACKTPLRLGDPKALRTRAVIF